jgi:putative ABC transport system permease protein
VHLRAPLPLRLAWAEIRADPRFALSFALGLALGLAGFVALDAFRTSLEAELEQRSRALLGADLQVVAGRPIRAVERESVDTAAGAGSLAIQEAELPSMVASGQRSRLAQVRAVEAAFPLRGSLELRVAGVLESGAARALEQERVAWLAPELAAQLGVGIGDEIRVGRAGFRVADVLERDAGASAEGFGFAPRVYLGWAHLPATELIQFGSRASFRRLYRLPDTIDPEALAGRLRSQPELAELRVQSHRDASEQAARATAYLTRFLALVALVALLLAGVGAAFLFSAFVHRRLREVAILISVGASFARAQAVYVWQLALLGIAAAATTTVLVAWLVPRLPELLGAEFLPVDVAPRIGPRSAAVALATAWLGSLLVALPTLTRLRALKPARLLGEAAHPELGPRWWAGVLYLPALVFFWALCAWQARSAVHALWFVGGLAAACLGLGASGWGLLALAERTLRGARGSLPRARARPLALRLGLRHLVRHRPRALAAFLAIGLATLLVGAVPQLRSVVRGEVEPPDGANLPSLFLFDIQDDQVDALRAHVAARGRSLVQLSPLIRARLTQVNGTSVPERSAPAPRDDEAPGPDERSRLLHRAYNLSYRPHVSSSERIVAGRDFGGRYAWGQTEPAEMTLEVDFAQRLGVGLGDGLTFDVQGVAVAGRVVGLREIRWASFEPNFFVQLQPGVLEDAPKTFLAALPRMERGEKEALQHSIVAAFPNVSAVDISALVGRLLAIAAQVELATRFMASLSLVAGLLLLYAIAAHQAQERRWETNLLKVLGADFARIRAVVDWEFGLLAGCAAVAGALGSLAFSAVLAHGVMGAPWRPDWLAALLSIPAIAALGIAAARLATRRVLRERPLGLLQRAA